MVCVFIWLLLFVCTDFPESKAAIEDLKFCLERTNQRQQLLTSLKSAFEGRLLHPGQSAPSRLSARPLAMKAGDIYVHIRDPEQFKVPGLIQLFYCFFFLL